MKAFPSIALRDILQVLHVSMKSQSPFAFFLVHGGSSSSDYLVHGEYCLRIDRDDDTRFIACTDYINYPDYGAIWLISEDRQTLTYSHTEDDL
jgi:hypothetical protein